MCSPEYNPGTTKRSAFSIELSPPILSGLVVLARLGWAVCSRNTVEGLLSDFSLWELCPRCTAIPYHVLGALLLLCLPRNGRSSSPSAPHIGSFMMWGILFCFCFPENKSCMIFFNGVICSFLFSLILSRSALTHQPWNNVYSLSCLFFFSGFYFCVTHTHFFSLGNNITQFKKEMSTIIYGSKFYKIRIKTLKFTRICQIQWGFCIAIVGGVP